MEHEPPAEINTVAILGLGLIGGSLARDLSTRGVRVLGWDADAESLRAAVDDGVIHHPLTDDLRGEDQADAVVLAVPVFAAPDLLRRLKPHLGSVRLVTDAGSTKASIVRAAESLGIGTRFVGSHPLAGDHRSGWSASRQGLFQAARVFLTRAPSTMPAAMHLAKELWTMVGAQPEEIDAAEHDRRLAWTSHVPQLLSSALGATLAGQGIGRGDLGPGGRDVTRLAGSDPEMWVQIALDNVDVLVPALKEAEERLRDIRYLIANGDSARLRDVLARAQAWHGA